MIQNDKQKQIEQYLMNKFQADYPSMAPSLLEEDDTTKTNVLDLLKYPTQKESEENQLSSDLDPTLRVPPHLRGITPPVFSPTDQEKRAELDRQIKKGSIGRTAIGGLATFGDAFANYSNARYGTNLKNEALKEVMTIQQQGDAQKRAELEREILQDPNSSVSELYKSFLPESMRTQDKWKNLSAYEIAPILPHIDKLVKGGLSKEREDIIRNLREDIGKLQSAAAARTMRDAVRSLEKVDPQQADAAEKILGLQRLMDSINPGSAFKGQVAQEFGAQKGTVDKIVDFLLGKVGAGGDISSEEFGQMKRLVNNLEQIAYRGYAEDRSPYVTNGLRLGISPMEYDPFYTKLSGPEWGYMPTPDGWMTYIIPKWGDLNWSVPQKVDKPKDDEEKKDKPKDDETPTRYDFNKIKEEMDRRRKEKAG